MLVPPQSTWALALLDERDLGAYNHERVRSYLEENPRCSVKELARALNMRTQTAGKHLEAVVKEMKDWG